MLWPLPNSSGCRGALPSLWMGAELRSGGLACELLGDEPLVAGGVGGPLQQQHLSAVGPVAGQEGALQVVRCAMRRDARVGHGACLRRRPRRRRHSNT